MRVDEEQANQIRLLCLPYWYCTPVRKYSSISYHHHHNNHSPIDDLPAIPFLSLSRFFFYYLTSMMTMLRRPPNVQILAIGGWRGKKRMRDVANTLVKTIYTAKQYNLCHRFSSFHAALHLRAYIRICTTKKKEKKKKKNFSLWIGIAGILSGSVIVVVVVV